MWKQHPPKQQDNVMTAEHIERIAQLLYELDRQKGIRSHRWLAGTETKRDTYRLRAHTLLASEDFACVLARLENQYWRTGRLIHEHFRPVPTSSARH
jgi:hypothetical protein